MRLVRRSLLEYFAGLGLSSTLLDPGVGRIGLLPPWLASFFGMAGGALPFDGFLARGCVRSWVTTVSSIRAAATDLVGHEFQPFWRAA